MKNLLIHTPCGDVQGVEGRQGCRAFKGIRYATAGRWEYPVPVTHWDGVYNADAFGACSYQPRAFYNEEDVPEKAFYYNEFRRGEHSSTSGRPKMPGTPRCCSTSTAAASSAAAATKSTSTARPSAARAWWWSP